MNNSNTLRTQYVDDLKAQKILLNNILINTGTDSNINNSFDTMISSVLTLKGKQVLPYYNFSGCESPELQNRIKDINFTNQTSLGGCFAYWKTPDLSSVNTINAKIMDRFVYGNGVDEQDFIVTLGEKFRLDNCVSLNNFLSSAYVQYSDGNKLKLNHNKVQKQVVLNPISLNNLLNWIVFDSVDEFKNIINFFKKITFTEITSLNYCLYNCSFKGNADEFSELISELFDILPLNKVKSMSVFMRDTNFSGNFKFKPKKKQIFEELTTLDNWFPYFTRLICEDLSNWEFKKVETIIDFESERNGGETLEYVHMGYNKEPSLKRLEDCFMGASRLHTLDFSGWNFGGFNYFYRNWYDPPKKLVYIWWGYDHGKSYTRKESNSGSYKFSWGGMESLSKESVIDLFNKLYDLNISYGVYDEEGNPGTGTLYTQQIVLHANVKSQLTPEEIAIATNKGWTVV